MSGEIIQVFLEEAAELIVELEEALLALEDDPSDSEAISRVFRAMHTIKGTGAMLGFEEASEFTHHVETFYDLIRSGKLRVDKHIIDLTLRSRDYVEDLIFSNGRFDKEYGEEIITEFHKRADGLLYFEEEEGAETIERSENIIRRLYHIRFRPSRKIMHSGNNPLYLIEDVLNLGSGEVFTYLNDIPDLAHIKPENIYLYWDITLVTDRTLQDIEDVFMFVEDDASIDIKDFTERLSRKKNHEYDTEDMKRMAEFLLDREDINEEVMNSFIKQTESLKKARKTGDDSPKDVRRTDSIRISAEKLDNLVNLAGELVIAQTQLTERAGKLKDDRLQVISREIERLSSELRDGTMGARMLTVSVLFSKFKRLVRDLSGKLGKEVRLEMEGEDTELDRSVIEKLNDPLLHIIRNSIDHGLEMPDERESVGKSKEGVIRLSARHEGSNVFIEVFDDGRGLPKDRILEKAVSNGIISADEELTDNEIFSLIFSPGFSTAEKVSDVSGRGVGMDVVSRVIKGIKGDVRVYSTPGKGTTVSLKIPLTMAIIDGFLVRIAEDFFVIPLSNIEGCIEIPDNVKSSRDNLIDFRGNLIPYINMKEHFQINASENKFELVVVVNEDGKLFGMMVDEVIGIHHTVIKPVGDLNDNIEEISGSTILGDGSVALILDIPLLREAIDH